MRLGRDADRDGGLAPSVRRWAAARLRARPAGSRRGAVVDPACEVRGPPSSRTMPRSATIAEGAPAIEPGGVAHHEVGAGGAGGEQIGVGGRQQRDAHRGRSSSGFSPSSSGVPWPVSGCARRPMPGFTVAEPPRARTGFLSHETFAGSLGHGAPAASGVVHRWDAATRTPGDAAATVPGRSSCRVDPCATAGSRPGVFRPWSADDGALVRLRRSAARGAPCQVGRGLAETYGDGSVHLTARANLQVRGLRTIRSAPRRGGVRRRPAAPAPTHELVRNIMVSPLIGESVGGPTCARSRPARRAAVRRPGVRECCRAVPVRARRRPRGPASTAAWTSASVAVDAETRRSGSVEPGARSSSSSAARDADRARSAASWVRGEGPTRRGTSTSSRRRHRCSNSTTPATCAARSPSPSAGRAACSPARRPHRAHCAVPDGDLAHDPRPRSSPAPAASSVVTPWRRLRAARSGATTPMA